MMGQHRPINEEALRAQYQRSPAPGGLSYDQCKAAALHWGVLRAQVLSGVSVHTAASAPTTQATGHLAPYASEQRHQGVPLPRHPPMRTGKSAAAGERDDD